jgi:hypothetical protein
MPVAILTRVVEFAGKNPFHERPRRREAVGRRFGTLDTMETERYFEAGAVAKAV